MKMIYVLLRTDFDLAFLIESTVRIGTAFSAAKEVKRMGVMGKRKSGALPCTYHQSFASSFGYQETVVFGNPWN